MINRLFLTFCLILNCAIAYPAIIFDGVDDIIDDGTNDDVFTENSAMTAYYRFVATIGTSMRLHDRNGVGSGNFFNIDAAGTLTFQVEGTTDLKVVTSTTLSSATEYVIILTWDGSTTATNVHIYIGSAGGALAEASYTTQQNGNTLVDTSGSDTTYGNRNAAERCLNGTYREFAYFTTVLTATERAFLNTTTRDGPIQIASVIRYYPMDDGADATSADTDTITDQTGTANGTGNDGANNAGLTWDDDTVLSYKNWGYVNVIRD